MSHLPRAGDGESGPDAGSDGMVRERRAARFSVALHGAVELLGATPEECIARGESEAALAKLLDDIERRMSEDMTMGGPPQGTA
jgi:hypothetical protein